MDYDKYSYVTNSKYRVTVFEWLDKGPMKPSMIAEKSGHDISHISRALQELRDGGLVELMVSEDKKKGRIYALSDKGDNMADDVINGFHDA